MTNSITINYVQCVTTTILDALSKLRWLSLTCGALFMWFLARWWSLRFSPPSIHKNLFCFFFPPTYTTWWWKPEGTRKIPRERQWEQKHFDLITFLSGERFLLITVSYQQFFSLSKPSFHLLPFSLFSLWLFIVTRVIHWDFLRVLTMFSVCVWKFKIGATMETQLKVGYLRNNARHQLKKYEGNGWVVNVR